MEEDGRMEDARRSVREAWWWWGGNATCGCSHLLAGWNRWVHALGGRRQKERKSRKGLGGCLWTEEDEKGHGKFFLKNHLHRLSGRFPSPGALYCSMFIRLLTGSVFTFRMWLMVV